ncbi:MAG: Gfo/Idh/MocA family oxidoreductase [Elusimicrobiota bacterium]|jgi:predicted dehydrogenase
MKGALIGFGQVAQDGHVPALSRAEGFEVVAVVDASAQRREAAKQAFPAARLYADTSALYAAEKLDFVDVATPPFLHFEQCLEALRRGAHVLCEKPVVFSSSEFETLRAEARKHKRALFPVHNWKYAPILRKWHDLLRSRVIGDLRHIELHVLRTKPSAVAGAKPGTNWRLERSKAGGGILVDHGWHNLYLLTWLMGAAPEGMDAVLRYPQGGDADDEASALLRFPDASALMHLTWRADRRAQWGVSYGRGGTIHMLDDRLEVLRSGEPLRVIRFAEKLSGGSSHPEWMQALMPDFAAACAHPSVSEPNFEEAGHCAALIESAYRRFSRKDRESVRA